MIKQKTGCEQDFIDLVKHHITEKYPTEKERIDRLPRDHIQDSEIVLFLNDLAALNQEQVVLEDEIYLEDKIDVPWEGLEMSNLNN